ncbi:MAG: hypothetical protein WCX77_01830 [Candidatus Paceibacterota bacterium]|jgi:hypothetical protein
MDFTLVDKSFLILIDVIGLWLAFWVYSSSPKEKINRLFCLMNLSFLFWWNGGYFFSYSDNLGFSLLLGRIILGEVSISFAIIYFFVTVFPYEEKRNIILDRAIIFLTVVFFLFSALTDSVVAGTRFTEWGIDPIFGKGQLLYYGWISFFIVLILAHFLKKYAMSTDEIKAKSRYFFIGFLIFFLMNSIFNVILPLLRGTIQYWQLGNYSAIFLLGFTAYAIVERNLFGIKTILTDLLVLATGTALLFLPVILDTLLAKIFSLAIFFFFCIGGYLLIRYAHRESKQKEILEGTVKQRTKELEQSKKVAEERAAELERWYKLTIGREVRMAELKEKISELESKK